MASISLNHVSKRYRVGRGLTNLRELFSSSKNIRSSKYHWAAKDVSFDLSYGESLGIIGPNGAGKTTLLKILSGVTRPTDGKVSIYGRLSALIELGAGFHPDLTGRENVFLNGTILGMRRSEISARFDEIVNFAEIDEYLDTPVKRYSSGMYARLGFAIAAHVDPDILIVDEVLAVGDYAFQMKCFARMDELRKKGTILIFVSHNLEAVRRVCNKGLLMYRGEPVFQGSTVDTITAYSDAIRHAARENLAVMPSEDGLSQRIITFDAEIEHAGLYNLNGSSASTFKSGSKALLIFDVIFHKDVKHPIFSFFVRALDGRLIYNTTTNWMNILTPNFSRGERCRVEFKIVLPLLDGNYDLGVDIASDDLKCYLDRMESAIQFWIQGPSEAQGLVDFAAEFELKRNLADGNPQ